MAGGTQNDDPFVSADPQCDGPSLNPRSSYDQESSMDDMRALDDAIRMLVLARQRLAHGADTVWRLVDDARRYLELQLEGLLRS